MTWQQHDDPLDNAVLSTPVAALPVAVLLGVIAWTRLRIHTTALLGLAVALGVALDALVGILVTLQTHVPPFTWMVVPLEGSQ